MNFNPFIHFVFISVVALFPVINPIGSAFMVNPYLSKIDNVQERRKVVFKITLYAFIICVATLFSGHWVLEAFGLTVPVIQLGGGIMICKMGWESLSGDDETDNSPVDLPNGAKHESLENKLFYPITFPVTTGAGTISVLFTLSAHSARSNFHDYLVNTGAIIAAIILMCLMVYLCYGNTKRLINYLGSNAEVIINRISSFFIFCVGLQIAATGLNALIRH